MKIEGGLGLELIVDFDLDFDFGRRGVVGIRFYLGAGCKENGEHRQTSDLAEYQLGAQLSSPLGATLESSLSQASVTAYATDWRAMSAFCYRGYLLAWRAHGDSGRHVGRRFAWYSLGHANDHHR